MRGVRRVRRARSSASTPAAHGLPTASRRRSPASTRSATSTSRIYRDDFDRTGLKPAVRSAAKCRSTSKAPRSCWSTTFSIRAAACAPRSTSSSTTAVRRRIELAVLIDRGGRELPIDATYGGARARRSARRLDRAVARRRRRASPLPPSQRRSAPMRNPQLNADGDAHAPAHARRAAGGDHHRASSTPRCRSCRSSERDVKKVPLLRGKLGVQPLLRELDADAHDLRDRRQAPVRRRDQPQHRRLVDEQGRDAARHGRQPGRDERRHVRRPPLAVRRAAPHRGALERARAAVTST